MRKLFAATVFATVVLITMTIALQLSARAQGLSQDPYYYRAGAQLVWSGDVDDTTLVVLRGSDVRTRDIHGKASINVNTQILGYLPDAPVNVYVKSWSGRGSVQIVREPNGYNNFTTAVRIYDPQAGRGHYSLVLGWGPAALAPPIRPF